MQTPHAQPERNSDNRLGEETSPYLLQHRDNPVAWRPWGDEAFAEARRLDRPVFLSIGYAACHWCHVMAHESFEDPAAARVMNELFVNIKVDREERPDVDQVYMAALHVLGERGGWPLTMFLMPDGRPFFGGTYFPPTARYGRPGFTDILRQIAGIWRDERGRVDRAASALSESLRREPPAAESAAGFGLPALDETARQLASVIDPVNGGPRGAPKFPNPALLEMLWRAGEREPGARMQALVALTLERMALGGIHDQLGGGFARYSVDERWLVPHFEKMLYDNAQLLELYALAWQATRLDLFREAGEGIVAWLSREMVTPEGAFAASLDADSEGQEGRFYVWSQAEIEDVLGGGDAAAFARIYDVTAEGNWEGRVILNRLDTPEPDAATAKRLTTMRAALLERRAGRVRPGLDDKCLADWNGLMIGALAKAGSAFGRPDWTGTAARTFRAIQDHLLVQGVLGHSWRAGIRLAPGFALDYAAMARAALALHEATGTSSYLAAAESLADTLLRDYRLESGILAMSVEAPDGPLAARPRPTSDDAIPNANAVAAETLWRLAVLTGRRRWHMAAEDLFAAVLRAAAASPLSHAGILNALDLRLRGTEILLLGPDREAFRDAALSEPATTRILLEAETADDLPAAHPARAAAIAPGETVAFICRDQSCSLPLGTPVALAKALGLATPEKD